MISNNWKTLQKMNMNITKKYFKWYWVIRKEFEIEKICNNILESKANPKSIDCEPIILDKKRAYFNLLISEAIMHNILIIRSDLETIYAELKICIESKAKVRLLKQILEYTTPTEGVKFIILQIVLYIMYIETRIEIKLLTLILQDELTNSKG